jgi:sugar/nucleoside kinase (ribokinase family)
MARTLIACAGAAHWDIVARAAAAPFPGCDLPGTAVRRPGGVALNIALALAAEGLAAALVSVIGLDTEGEALMAAAAGAGIATDAVLRAPEPTGCYTAIEGPDGALFASVADCAALDRHAGSLALPEATGLAILDGNLPAAVLARLSGACPDPILVPASPAKALHLRPLLPGATLYANLEEVAALTGHAHADTAAAALALTALGVRQAIVTDGPNPVALAEGTDVLTARPPAVTARSVTGAGDRLLAAHLGAMSRGLDAAGALDHAVAAAACHISRIPP